MMRFRSLGAFGHDLRQRAGIGTRSEREARSAVRRDAFFNDPAVVEDDYRRLRAPRA
jgi:hypothetical protein